MEDVGLPSMSMGDYAIKKALRDGSLDEKYIAETGPIFLTGTQALVKLTMLQRSRDLHRGLNTACFISGYRGSPLGGFDLELWKAKKHLKVSNIEFQPCVMFSVIESS